VVSVLFPIITLYCRDTNVWGAVSPPRARGKGHLLGSGARPWPLSAASEGRGRSYIGAIYCKYPILPPTYAAPPPTREEIALLPRTGMTVPTFAPPGASPLELAVFFLLFIAFHRRGIPAGSTEELPRCGRGLAAEAGKWGFPPLPGPSRQFAGLRGVSVEVLDANLHLFIAYTFAGSRGGRPRAPSWSPRLYRGQAAPLREPRDPRPLRGGRHLRWPYPPEDEVRALPRQGAQLQQEALRPLAPQVSSSFAPRHRPRGAGAGPFGCGSGRERWNSAVRSVLYIRGTARRARDG